MNRKNHKKITDAPSLPLPQRYRVQITEVVCCGSSRTCDCRTLLVQGQGPAGSLSDRPLLLPGAYPPLSDARPCLPPSDAAALSAARAPVWGIRARWERPRLHLCVAQATARTTPRVYLSAQFVAPAVRDRPKKTVAPLITQAPSAGYIPPRVHLLRLSQLSPRPSPEFQAKNARRRATGLRGCTVTPAPRTATGTAHRYRARPRTTARDGARPCLRPETVVAQPRSRRKDTASAKLAPASPGHRAATSGHRGTGLPGRHAEASERTRTAQHSTAQHPTSHPAAATPASPATGEATSA